jgi:MFS transporter, NNP family, nitrate/nitrite transporter
MATPSSDQTVLTTAERRGGRIAEWDPEDLGFWQRTGARVARRNLIFSVLPEHIASYVLCMALTWVVYLRPRTS